MIGKKLQKALGLAVEELKRRRHEYLTLEHVLYGIASEPSGRKLIERCGGSAPVLRQALDHFFKTYMESLDEPTKDVYQTLAVQRVLDSALAHVKSAGRDEDIGVEVGDVLAAIETSDLLRRVPGARERFWDMFVVDAFIKNPDRNNGNWGVLMTAPMAYELAPVYDMGSSLFSKRSPSVAARRLGDEEAEQEDAFGTNVSCYRLSDGEGGSVAIHPFEYMAKTTNPDLTAAIKRFAAAVDMGAIDALIDSVPEEAYGIVLLSESMREEHKRLLRKRLKEGILPLL